MNSKRRHQVTHEERKAQKPDYWAGAHAGRQKIGDDALLATFRSRFVVPRQRLLEELLNAAQRRGEIPHQAYRKTALEALHDMFGYRLLQQYPLDKQVTERLARFILSGLGVLIERSR